MGWLQTESKRRLLPFGGRQILSLPNDIRGVSEEARCTKSLLVSHWFTIEDAWLFAPLDSRWLGSFFFEGTLFGCFRKETKRTPPMVFVWGGVPDFETNPDLRKHQSQTNRYPYRIRSAKRCLHIEHE